MLNKLRSSAITVFCAYILFVVAGLAFQKLTEYEDFTEAVRAHADVGIAFQVILIGSVIALLAVLAGGLPLAWDAVKQAYATQRRDLLLLAVPPLSLAVVVGFPLLLLPLIDNHVSFPDPRAIVIAVIYLSLFLLAAVASIAAVSLVVARYASNERLLRFSQFPAAVTTASMALMLVATISWGLSLKADIPQLFASNEGILGTSTALTWLGIVVVMTIATGIAAISLLRSIPKQSEGHGRLTHG